LTKLCSLGNVSLEAFEETAIIGEEGTIMVPAAAARRPWNATQAKADGVHVCNPSSLASTRRGQSILGGLIIAEAAQWTSSTPLERWGEG
jgi:hypothetical protein